MARDTTRLTTDNVSTERALWLAAAVRALRDYFKERELPLPENLRLGFSTNNGKTLKTGECWHSPASADGHYEIFIRADQDDPFKIVSILVRELVHAALPVDESHGKRFKAAATKIGLVGKMRDAVPAHWFEPRIRQIVEELGPLPHRSLDLSWTAFGKPKPQTGRMLKATCTAKIDDLQLIECGYSVRLSAKWADIGARCPLHGEMTIHFPLKTE